MPAKTMNISLTPELKASVEARVRSGHYGNASDVIRAGLRALAREEIGNAYAEWRAILARLPSDPLTPQIEQGVEAEVKAFRRRRQSKVTR